MTGEGDDFADGKEDGDEAHCNGCARLRPSEHVSRAFLVGVQATAV